VKTETLLQHFGEEEKVLGAVTPPLFQNSLYTFPSCDEFMQTMQALPEQGPYVYARVGNPTARLVEEKIAALEGTETARLFAGGMAAISMGIMTQVAAGAHVVCADTCYGPTRQLLQEYLPKFGVATTFVDARCHEDVFDAVRPETTLIFLESPSSMLFRLQNLELIGRYGKEKKITTMIDSTWATPLFQNPARYGIDIVAHSASKYLGGHSDVIAGVLCGSHEWMARMTRTEVQIYAPSLSPFAAWLLLRGMRTLPVRMKQHQESGNRIAAYLEDHPAVERVFHPGLMSHPQRDLVTHQMHGTSSLFSFQPKVQSTEEVKAIVDRLVYFGIGVSWGGFESLAIPAQVQPLDWMEPRWIIRVHIGLEDTDDLIRDLDQALCP
jgi:cystathionine beta-lyase/cystathionine gamma-synthase